MNSELTTLATIFLASHRATFNFIEVSEDGNIPNEFSLNIPIFGDSVDKNEFIPAIFETVETEFNWEFITDGVIFTPTVKDGYGVDQFDFIVSKDRMYLVEDFDEEKNLLTEELVTNALFFYMKAHKIEDFVFVQADTTALHVWRLVKKMPWTSLGEQGDEAEFDDVDVTHVKVDWQQAINKSKQDTWDRIYRFLTTSKPASEVKDVWANLMFAPKLHYESVLAQDILRADLTANLHSIRTSAMKSLADFGASSSTKSVLMAAGDLVLSMENSHILLALIDGLGLYGNIQMFLDKKDIFLSTAPFMVRHEGKYARALKSLLSVPHTLISAEPKGIGDPDEVVVNGRVTLEGQETQDFTSKNKFYGLRNRIHKITIEEPSVLILDPLKVKDLGGLDEYVEHHNITGEVILDTRETDSLVYGPEPRLNQNKVHMWLAGLR